MGAARSLRRAAGRSRRRRAAAAARGRTRLDAVMFGVRVAGGLGALGGGVALAAWTLSLPPDARPTSRRGGGLTLGVLLAGVGVVLLRSARRQARGGATFAADDLSAPRPDAAPRPGGTRHAGRRSLGEPS